MNSATLAMSAAGPKLALSVLLQPPLELEPPDEDDEEPSSLSQQDSPQHC